MYGHQLTSRWRPFADLSRVAGSLISTRLSLFWKRDDDLTWTRARTGLDSLRAIHAEDPSLSKEIELYIDGGVRRGTDVLQAIAFGARGVGLGRPFLYAQAAFGEQGVIRAVRSESAPRFSVQDVVLNGCSSGR